MEINQVLVSASPGDAITNSAFELRSLLRRIGPSDIYARYIHEDLADEIFPLGDYVHWRSARPHDDLLLFHASIGEPELLAFLTERPERLVVVYHNISPSGPFLTYDPAFAGLLDGGRRELEVLADRAALALADSTFNAEELRAIGYRDVRVSPLIVDVQRLLTVEPDPGTSNHLTTQLEGPVVLFVGQLLPHKRPDFLIESYHVMVTELEPTAHLILVGSDRRLPRYVTALRHLINELNLTRAWITGGVTAEELAAFYRRADLFATASEHEGFCVPLLEAMAFDVPVLARGCGAVPETLGDAGLLLPADAGPTLAAEAMAEILGNDQLRQELISAGHRRLCHYAPERARETFLRHLLSAV
jgi:glycosyltransferase involved in cell wall biosynthesis